MALCAKILELHGGKWRLKSEPEKGTVEDVWLREDVETLGTDERKDDTDAWISNGGYIFPEAEKIVAEAQCRELYEGNEKLLVLVNRDRTGIGYFVQ